MEGKELYNNEDEELDPKSKKEEDADDFGLPEIEDADDKASGLGDPYSESWEDKKEEEDYSYSSDDDTPDTDYSDDYSATTESSDSDYGYSDEADSTEDEVDSTEEEYQSSSYEEEYEQKKSPVGWIIFGVFVLIAIIVGVFWWLNRDTKPEPEPIPAPVMEQPVQEEEPQVIEEESEPVEPEKTAGVFEINEPTGRYHVIVASSIDSDLVRDYGNKLAAQQGMTCNILAPRGNKIFHRLSVADYVSLNDATLKSEQLKGTLGNDVWVIRY